LYVSPVAIESSMATGATTSAEVHLELDSLGGDLEGLRL